MSCSKPKCRNKSDDLMVSCWLCDSVYHAKCVDLAARTADNLREDKGLRWCCKKCTAFDIEFYKFFKNTRIQFNDIENDLNNLLNKFTKYKELLVKTPCSPKRKKPSTIASTQFSDKTVEIVCDNLLSETSSTCYTSSIVRPLIAEKGPFYVSQLSPALPTNTVPSIVRPVIAEKSSVKASEHSSNSSALPTKTVPFAFPSPTPCNSANSPAQVNLNSSVPVFKPSNKNPILKVVSPKKTVFAARFASSTTTDDIKLYIMDKIGFKFDITVFKFKYSEPRNKTSFKIIVPEEYFDRIVNQDFWPLNALIREYEYKNTSNTDIVYLPQSSSLKN